LIGLLGFLGNPLRRVQEVPKGPEGGAAGPALINGRRSRRKEGHEVARYQNRRGEQPRRIVRTGWSFQTGGTPVSSAAETINCVQRHWIGDALLPGAGGTILRWRGSVLAVSGDSDTGVWIAYVPAGTSGLDFREDLILAEGVFPPRSNLNPGGPGLVEIDSKAKRILGENAVIANTPGATRLAGLSVVIASDSSSSDTGRVITLSLSVLVGQR